MSSDVLVGGGVGVGNCPPIDVNTCIGYVSAGVITGAGAVKLMTLTLPGVPVWGGDWVVSCSGGFW